MTERCCRRMEFYTRTRDEHLAMLAKLNVKAAKMGNPPEPLVELRPPGVYVIRYVGIAYCPWCGTRLPSFSEEDLRKLGYKEFPASG